MTQINSQVKDWMIEQHSQAALGQRPAEHTEKRNCPRYPFSGVVEAFDIVGDVRLMGRLSDISRNGCYIDTINPFARGVAATLTITKGAHSFTTQAKVVYSSVGMGMGLLFTTAEPEQLRVLGSWLSELSGGKTAPHNAPVPVPLPVKDAPNQVMKSGSANTPDQELRAIVGELIALLNAKNLLNDSEGMALLRKLSR